MRGETSSAQALPHSNHMRDGADLGAEREVPALNLGNVEPANLTETTAF